MGHEDSPLYYISGLKKNSQNWASLKDHRAKIPTQIWPKCPVRLKRMERRSIHKELYQQSNTCQLVESLSFLVVIQVLALPRPIDRLITIESPQNDGLLEKITKKRSHFNGQQEHPRACLAHRKVYATVMLALIFVTVFRNHCVVNTQSARVRKAS